MSTTLTPLQPWQRVFRNGLVPQLSRETLLGLRQALIDDDPMLIQGDTTLPPVLDCPIYPCPVEGACLIGFCGLVDGLNTVSEVHEFFNRILDGMERQVGYASSWETLVDYWDNGERADVRREVLIEIDEVLNHT